MVLKQSERAAMESLSNAQLLDIIHADNRRLRSGNTGTEREISESSTAREILTRRLKEANE